MTDLFHDKASEWDTRPIPLQDGSFHPPEAQGVFHDGFDRDALADLAEKAGFVDVAFVTACTVDREERRYPIFLCTATRPL